MVFLERVSLVVGLYYDWRGRKFEAQGIPVVSGAFMPMTVPAPGTPLSFGGKADPADLARARALMDKLCPEVKAALKTNDFNRVAAACAQVLGQLDDLEAESKSHFIMAKHIVESLGFGALNGIACAKLSGGATVGLSRDLVRVQLMAIGSAVEIDRLAQECHALGAGILVNDLPHIPFLEEWSQLAPNL